MREQETCKVHGALRRSPDCPDQPALEESTRAFLLDDVPLRKAHRPLDSASAITLCGADMV